MKMDSEEQRQQILNLLAQVPVQTNLQGLLAGADKGIIHLVQTIQQAPLEDGTPSALQGHPPQLPAGSGGDQARKTPRRSGQKNQPR